MSKASTARSAVLRESLAEALGLSRVELTYSHCFNPISNDTEEAQMVKLFRSLGGIPFCKTNVPQVCLMWY